MLFAASHPRGNIPYEKSPLCDGYHKPIMWQSRAYEYLLDEEIRNGRDPELTGAADDDELRMVFLRQWEVALTCWLDDGISVILDTRSNTIRVIDESEPPENDFREESIAHHAPNYLQKVIDDIRNLAVIYFPGGEIGYIHLPGSWELIQVKRILTRDFGWGTEGFREEDWRREGEEICQAIGDEGQDK